MYLLSATSQSGDSVYREPILSSGDRDRVTGAGHGVVVRHRGRGQTPGQRQEHTRVAQECGNQGERLKENFVARKKGF